MALACLLFPHYLLTPTFWFLSASSHFVMKPYMVSAHFSLSCSCRRRWLMCISVHRDFYWNFQGASSGIGRATAVLFAKLGSRLALVARDEKRLQETLDECRQASSLTASDDKEPFICIPADLSDTKQIETAFKHAMDHFSQLDILVWSWLRILLFMFLFYWTFDHFKCAAVTTVPTYFSCSLQMTQNPMFPFCWLAATVDGSACDENINFAVLLVVMLTGTGIVAVV